MNIFESVFNLFKTKKDSKTWLDDLKIMSKLSNEVNTKNKELNEKVFSMYKENSDELFISLKDFLEFFESPSGNINEVLKKFKHTSEIDLSQSSYIEVYPIMEDNHITLCSDVKNCKQHKNYSGNKIKIVMVK